MAGVGAVIENGQVTNQVSAETKAAEKAKDTAGQYKDQFLQLLVAQMKYQDPMQPTSNTEYISQYATFSTVEQMQSMSQTMSISRASDMVGKYVVIHEDEGSDGTFKEVEGRVDFVTIENNKAKVSVNGTSYDVDKVYSVISEDFESASTKASAFTASMDQMPMLSRLTLADSSEVARLQQAYEGLDDMTRSMIPNSYITALEQYVAKIASLNNLQSQTQAVNQKTDQVVDETQETQAGASSTDAAEEGTSLQTAADGEMSETDTDAQSFESAARDAGALQDENSAG